MDNLDNLDYLYNSINFSLFLHTGFNNKENISITLNNAAYDILQSNNEIYNNADKVTLFGYPILVVYTEESYPRYWISFEGTVYEKF